MRENSIIRPNRLSFAVSMAMALLAADVALAQEVKPAPTSLAQDAKKPAAPAVKKPAAAVVTTDVNTVVVVGARESQRSSIARKKNAKTAMDSIVAEDVGAFPDRNVGEAISRIAGVALDRGDFGEGVSVSVRGNGADLTRVELDGQAVQAGGGTDLLGGGDGRGVEFREMSSDLIKSVDVVKGSTADMVEGSLGGGIIIKTRTGLDFKKPFYSLRLGASQGSLNKKTSPNVNLVVADKFLDNRLGVLLNVNASQYYNEAHSLANGGSNNTQGPLRQVDFDNSPEKTFSFNPAALSKTEPSVTKPFLMSPLTAGGTFDASSPIELVTRSGAAATKADCNAAFPALTSAQTGAINGPTARTAAINQRSNELITCLNQWNDYSPSIIRSIVKQQNDKRTGADLRFDYKVNSALSVYAKGSINRRTVDDHVSFYNLGNVSVNNAAVNSPTTGYIGSSIVDANAAVRAAAPKSGYYTYASTPSFRAGATPAMGATANVKPGYTVDDSHHLTKYTITDGGYGTDQINSKVETSSKYLQLGGAYKSGDLFAEFFVGSAKSDSMRHDVRAAYNYGYGEATFSLLPDGAWAFALPEGSNRDQLNYANYAPLAPAPAQAAAPLSATNSLATPAYTPAQRALYTPTTNLQVIRARKSESGENTARADVTFRLRDRVPFLTSIKTGFNLRDTSSVSWGLGGGAIKDPIGTFGTPGYQPGAYLPNLNARSSVVGCQNTPGSLAPGGQPCAYGYNPSTNPTAPLFGQTVLSPAAYLDMVKQTLSVAPSGQFYGGAKGRADGLINGWNQIDMAKLYQLAGIEKHLDCIVRCTATDGKDYDQAISRYDERSYAGYLMTDFELNRFPFTRQPLPFGIELSGNMGYRIVKTNVKGTGQLAFTSIKKTAAYDPANPDAAAGIVTATFRQNTSIEDDTTDILPIFNLAAWIVPNKLVLRYNRAKTVARPGLSRLLPNINCRYDERRLDAPDDADGSDADQTCTGTMGNPGIKPFTNINSNFAVEWYVNKDTMFSAATFVQRGRIGAPNGVIARSGVKVFGASDFVDPVSGVKLSDVDFTFNQYDNLKPSTRRGVEFGTKTAFTFLPSVLRYTGFDANYTRVRSTEATPTLDLLTGDTLPPPYEPKYSYNASLWYDDGALSARLALQVVAPRYSCFAPCTNSNVGVNNFPADGASSWRLPYNPGLPNFIDRTRYLDAKMAYRFKNNIELFAEVRNLTGERTHNSTGGYEGYSSGAPNLFYDNYNGRRVMVGLNIRSAQ
ncbi:TonB-dependent receptor [Massilia sp. TSP1-1-2]|uniref:TonB-dependent receptor n=1 Tax=Massilia sp. TSP1-1-2 TaxID=2804649 RepID=UPI003CEED066